jgi:glycerophosphoryl diester phosphodiesterase
MTTLIHHAASYKAGLPPGSLSGLQVCLEADVAWVEVDIIPLKGGDFALLHDPQLAHICNQPGLVYEKTADEIIAMVYSSTDRYIGGSFLGTLSQAVELLNKQNGSSVLQLDLKPYMPLTSDVLDNLLNIIAPVKEQILVSSVADWAVRSLHYLDGQLALGFDPLLYLDVPGDSPRPDGVPPFRKGAYGYLDEHPLSIQRWGSEHDYFEKRAEALYLLAPQKATWYLNAELLNGALSSGFDWIAFLQNRDCKVDAWTLDMDRIELAHRLAFSGVDYLTTNQAQLLADTLDSRVIL